MIYRIKRFSKTFYHNADLSDVAKIRTEGLIPQTGKLTIGEVQDKTNEEIPPVVYLGNKLMAGGTGEYRKKHGYSNNSGHTFKIEIPDEEFKKLHIVQNPECLGAKSEADYIRIREQLDKGKGDIKEYKQRWKVINPPYTVCVTDPIPPRYITN